MIMPDWWTPFDTILTIITGVLLLGSPAIIWWCERPLNRRRKGGES